MTQSSTAVDGAGYSAFDDDAGTRPTVTALLVVQRGHAPWIDQTLTALAAQQRRPERLVIVDATPERMMPDRVAADPALRDAFPDVSVVTVQAGTPFAALIDTAVDALPAPGEDVVVARRPRRRARAHKIRPRDKHEWLWLLHEDSAPTASALANLMRVIGPSHRVGVAGCKVTRLDDPRRLVGVGIDVTRSGRHVGAAMAGELDQGQHDDRRDVLAVSSAGLIVRHDVYTRLGGFDPAFDGDGDGLDLCWRAHLSGHQVIVVPAAVIHQDLAARYDARDHPAPRGARTLRRHRQVALARSSLLGMPVLAAWTALTSALLAVLFLLLKRPRRAGAELAQATAPFGVARILGARMRFFGRSSARRRTLRTLFVPLSAAARSAVDSLRDAITPEQVAEPGSAVAACGDDLPASPGRGRQHGVLTSPGLLVVLLLAAASAVMWRGLLASGALRGTGDGLAGGQLQPFATTADGIWRMWRDGWVGPGLGHANVPTPSLPILAGLAWLVQWIPGTSGAAAGATVVTWLLVLAMPLSALAAYRAGRVATPARWPRAAAALAWAGLATLTGAVAGGRLGPVVAHIVLPFAIAGVFAIARRRASAPVTFGTVLAAATVAAFAPALLILLTAAALAVLIIGPGWARLRGLLVAVLPWLLLAPWTRAVLRDDWRMVLAGPGQLAAAHDAQPWQLALLHPGGPGSYAVLAGAPVLAAGVLGLLRPGHRRAQAGLLLLALFGLAAALAAPHVMLVRSPSGALLSPWSGTALDVLAAALLGMALLGSAGLTSWQRRRPTTPDKAGPSSHGSSGRSAVTALTVAAMLVGAGIAGLAAWTAPVTTLRAAAAPLPGIVSEPVHGSRQVRALTLTVLPDGTIDYRLQGAETSVPARGLHPDASTGQAATAAAVTGLLGGGDTASLAAQLRELAVHTVMVQGGGDAARLTQSLQATGILSPLRAAPGVTAWRVAPMEVAGGARTVDSSRVTLYVDGSPSRELPSRTAHARTSTWVPAGPRNRLVVLSEGRGWQRIGRVTLDGHPLAKAEVAGWPAYRLGSRGGHLVIDPGAAFPLLRWAQGALLLLCLFLAVPFGNRTSRRRA